MEGAPLLRLFSWISDRTKLLHEFPTNCFWKLESLNTGLISVPHLSEVLNVFVDALAFTFAFFPRNANIDGFIISDEAVFGLIQGACESDNISVFCR